MTEIVTAPQPEVPAANRPDVLLVSPEWAALEPNHPHECDLLPTDLGSNQVDEMIQHLTDRVVDNQYVMPGTGEGVRDSAGGVLFPIESQASSKVVFRYQQGSKSMIAAVVPGEYTSESGIPANPNAIRLGESPTRRLIEYSDGRTYGVFTMPDGRKLMLMEDLGSPRHDAVAAVTQGIVRRVLTRRIKNTLSGITNMSGVQGELRHSRHYLYKPGSSVPRVIDIPIETAV